MKKYLLVIPLVLLICFVVSCQDKTAMAELEQFKAKAALEEENMALATRYHDAVVKGDAEALKEMLSPEFIWHSLYGGKVGLERNMKNFERQRARFPDKTCKIEDIIAKGDKVVVWYLAKWTLGEDVEDLPVPVTGKMVEFGGIEIIRISNKKITDIWELVDWAYFYQQLGFELKPKEAGK